MALGAFRPLPVIPAVDERGLLEADLLSRERRVPGSSPSTRNNFPVRCETNR